MDRSRIADLPRLPAEIPEWEDLLVRFEIMARALRVTMEEARLSAAAAAPILRRILREEAELAAWLHRATTGEEPHEASPAHQNAAGDDPRRLADRFASLRARNFAMLQRRGIDVWEWSAPLGDAGPVTAYQMVTGLVQADAEALRDLRDGIRVGAATC